MSTDSRTTDPLLVLLVEDDDLQRQSLARLLTHRGLAVVEAASGAEAIRSALGESIAVAVVDLNLPDMLGYDVVRRLREVRPFMECVVLTGARPDGGPDHARLAGASDYFEKPVLDHPRFFQVIRRACEVFHLRRTVELLGAPGSGSRLVGRSEAIVELERLIGRFAATSASVLVTGESGSGKEVVAEALHEQSGRRGEFVRINCAALPESLIEAELFGVEDGTFTGQKGRREGLFALADHGTLFLDEIGEMPLGLQPKLLRVLQSGKFRPLGARTERDLSARVIAATNVDLRAAIVEKRFREDLFFRLAVLEIRVPALRDRADDVPLLASHFGKKFAAAEGREAPVIDPAAMAELIAYPWPGNVRELANTMLRAIILQTGRCIGATDLQLPSAPTTVRKGTTTRAVGAQTWEALYELPFSAAKEEAMALFSRGYLDAKLRKCNGNVTRAASLAAMHRPNFKREMRKYHVLAEVDD